MNVYFGHSRDLDYEKYYNKIEESEVLQKYNFILPHKLNHNTKNGRAFYNKNNIDIFIAEVSLASTGLGIELGWAYEEDIPTYCFYHKKNKPSNAIRSVTDNFIEYEDKDDFINKLNTVLKSTKGR